MGLKNFRKVGSEKIGRRNKMCRQGLHSTQARDSHDKHIPITRENQMFRKIILWWRTRQCEKDLRFLRDCQRKHPEDATIPQMIAIVEAQHFDILSERISRRLQSPFVYVCSFCQKENRNHVRPECCRYCGKDAPSDAKRIVRHLVDGEREVR